MTRMPNIFKIILLLSTGFILAGCLGRETFSHGFRASDEDIAQVPVGSSVEQVQLVFGSPSTTSLSGETPIWYYISQTASKDLVAVRKLQDQRVLAVRFDENDRVSNINNYGLKDGKIFDFATKTTPTGGEDMTLIRRLMDVEALSNGL